MRGLGFKLLVLLLQLGVDCILLLVLVKHRLELVPFLGVFDCLLVCLIYKSRHCIHKAFDIGLLEVQCFQLNLVPLVFCNLLWGHCSNLLPQLMKLRLLQCDSLALISLLLSKLDVLWLPRLLSVAMNRALHTLRHPLHQCILTRHGWLFHELVVDGLDHLSQ